MHRVQLEVSLPCTRRHATGICRTIQTPTSSSLHKRHKRSARHRTQCPPPSLTVSAYPSSCVLPRRSCEVLHSMECESKVNVIIHHRILNTERRRVTTTMNRVEVKQNEPRIQDKRIQLTSLYYNSRSIFLNKTYWKFSASFGP